MTDQLVLLELAIVAALLAAVFALLGWRAAEAAVGKQRLLLEQNLAGGRAEAETTRAVLAASEGRLNAAIQTGTTDALNKAFAQIATATQNMASAVESLRRAAGEDSQKTLALLETRLTAIQTSVNEKLHEAVEQQMTNSFARVLEQFAQVQQAMGEVQSAAAQIGDLKRIFSNVKTRGGWGEAQLGAMLEQVLPPGSFERNYALREAYTALRVQIPESARVQYDVSEGGYFGAARMLESNRQAITSEEPCNVSFGGDARKCPEIERRIDRLFPGEGQVAPPAAEAVALCGMLGADALMATRWDRVWSDSEGWVWKLPAVVEQPEVRVVACKGLREENRPY